ncbi:MAG: signal peptidase II [Clostridia bacterium]|nr:signal peptidase II [Clostridia bacterium]
MNLLLGICIVLADAATKLLAIRYLMPVDTLPLWEGIFHLTYVENRGAAFGMMQGGRVFFIVISILIIGAMLYVAKRYKNRSRFLDHGIVFITAGAIGNMIDRIFRGFVVDFLDFCLIDYPVFNVADIFVCIGAGLVAIFIIFFEDKKDCKKNEN